MYARAVLVLDDLRQRQDWSWMLRVASSSAHKRRTAWRQQPGSTTCNPKKLQTGGIPKDDHFSITSWTCFEGAMIFNPVVARPARTPVTTNGLRCGNLSCLSVFGIFIGCNLQRFTSPKKNQYCKHIIMNLYIMKDYLEEVPILDIMPTASMQECLQPGDDAGDLLQTKAPTVCILYLQTIMDDR